MLKCLVLFHCSTNVPQCFCSSKVAANNMFFGTRCFIDHPEAQTRNVVAKHLIRSLEHQIEQMMYLHNVNLFLRSVGH